MDIEIVTTMESQDPMVIAWAKGALSEAGIPFYVGGEQIGVLGEAYSRFWFVCTVPIDHFRSSRNAVSLRGRRG